MWNLELSYFLVSKLSKYMFGVVFHKLRSTSDGYYQKKKKKLMAMSRSNLRDLNLKSVYDQCFSGTTIPSCFSISYSYFCHQSSYSDNMVCII